MLGHNCLQFRLWKPNGNIIFALVLLLSTSSVSYVSSTETVKGPHRHVVLKKGHEGHTIIMSCTTQLKISVAMYFQSAESKTSKEIYDRYEVIDGYKKMFNVTHHSRLPKHYTLSTNKVERNQAGEYTCYDNEGIGPLLSTTVLTVVDSKPHCNKTREIESPSFVLSCRFSFVGTVSNLNFQWVINDPDGPRNLPDGDIKISSNSVVCTVTVRDNDVSLDKHITFIVRRKECNDSSCFLYQTPLVLTGVSDRFSSFQTTEVNAENSLSRTWTMVIVIVLAVGLICIATCIIIAILVIRFRRRKNTEAACSTQSEIKKPISYDEDPSQLTVMSVCSFNDQQSTVSSISRLIHLLNPNANKVEKKSRFRVSTDHSEKRIKQNFRSAPTMSRIDSCSENMDTMQP